MTLAEFAIIVAENPSGVVLMEGRRRIPQKDAALATRLGRKLALRYPELRFRSGNAEGSDEAFSAGIAKIAAPRLQVVAPYAAHRKSVRHAGAIYASPDTLSLIQEDAVARKTAKASPKNRGLIQLRGKRGALAAKAAYLIRDTMKVVGHSKAFPKPFCALFYVDLDDPMAGGTGHTLRVCQQEGVPFAFQDSWQRWLRE